jgi:hypothetical protein
VLVERHHQLAPQPFAERVHDEQSLELGDELGVAPEREVGFDAVLERGESQLLESPALCLGEGVVGEVDKRRPSPQRERLAQKSCPLTGIVASYRVRHEHLEPRNVDLGGIDLEDVTGRAGE